MPVGDHYTLDEWGEISRDATFDPVDGEQLSRLHRHWIWANHSRRTFEEALRTEGWSDFEDWTARTPWSMYVWYGFLYVVLEAFTSRRILTRSPLVVDINQIREPLRNVRHAVFHADRDHDYYDPRLIAIVREGPDQVRRVHQALGQLALEEIRCRAKQTGPA
jgi:hypothetical protein